ncbi:MAG: UDP-N-acetylglucosamine 2-epimerase (non-hydrolyzing) [Planctomycetota bacterium]
MPAFHGAPVAGDGSREIALTVVAGARPNFVKVAPLLDAFSRIGEFRTRLVHTGQHYDTTLSDVFFRDLGLPAPDAHLGAGSGTHAEETARVIMAIEGDFLAHRPEIVVVVGDVNSTLAAALTAAKLNIPVAHVEAGLRSGDRAMPEEINRILTDAISDYCFTTTAAAGENLRREGVPDSRIHFAGNVMVDALVAARSKADALTVLEDMGLSTGGYALLTLHRPATVDVPDVLDRVLGAVREIAREIPVIFPVHPRTRARLGAASGGGGLRLVEPMGYLRFLKLMTHARLVLTDSGGIQEETTFLGVPCITLRENTERPETVETGTNRLAGTTPEGIRSAARDVLAGRLGLGRIPALWDGRAAERVAETLRKAFL